MYLTIASLLLFFSCASPKIIVTEEKPPFLKRYKKKEKELLYVVVKGQGNTDATTMALIKETIKKFDPEIIVTKFPPHDHQLFDLEISQCQQNQKCSAVAWSCVLAKPRGIPCLTGEPFDSDILKRSVQDGIDFYKHIQDTTAYDYSGAVKKFADFGHFLSNTGRQKEAIEISRKQIAAGEFKSNDEVMSGMRSWLKEK